MARKKNPTTELVAEVELNQEVIRAPEALKTIDLVMSEERDLVNQLLGQAQMAGAFEEFSRTVRISKLAFVKENKLYQSLKGKRTPDGPELSGTWAEFCNLLGRSVDQIDEDIKNLRQFGEQALESMSSMGIGYRELRQYRRLPEDEKTALIEAAKSGDQGAFLDLAEEMIARHAKEKESQQKVIEETTADLEATRQILQEEKTAHQETKVDFQKFRRRFDTLLPDERVAELRQEVAKVAYEAEVNLAANLREAFGMLAGEAQASGIDHGQYLSSLMHRLETVLYRIRQELALPEVEDASEFDWDDDTPAEEA